MLMLASSKRKFRRAWLLRAASESQRAEKTVLQDNSCCSPLKHLSKDGKKASSFSLIYSMLLP